MKDTTNPLDMVSLDAVVDSNLDAVVIAYRSPGSGLPYPTLDATFEGSEASSVAVIESDADYGKIANGSDVEILALPTDAKSRREILAEWATKAAKKNKRGLIPLMLLPLAACGGGGGVTTTPNPFSVAEDANTAGKWIITPSDGGSVTITQGGGDYTLTPSTGAAETVAVASVGELSLAAGSFSATVAALETVDGTEPVTGSGDIALTALEGDLDADLSVVTTSGTKTVAVSDAAGTVNFTGDLGAGFAVSVGTGSTLSTSASTLDGQSISGAGAVVISGDLSNDLGVDLSNISTTGASGTIAVTETAGGVFTSDADLGKAAVTITGGTMDLQAAGVSGVDASTFVVNAGELVLTHAQVDAVSNTAAITGTAGSVTVIAGSDSATGVDALLNDGNTQSTTVLVKVDMSGAGTLKFDLPSDDNDTLVLEAGSVINFGSGGTLIVDDGDVDARNLTNASDFAGVDNVRVNSGLSLTVSQLKTVDSIETSGSGSLSVVIEKESDIADLKALIKDGDAGNPLKGDVKPALTLETKADAADAASLETKLVDEAAAIAEAAQIAVPVKTLTGGIIYTSPSVDVRTESDSGISSTDNVSTDATPQLKIILPNKGISLETGDTVTVTVRTYDGSSYTTVSNETITLDAVDGSVGKNVNTDENGNSYILYNNVNLVGDNGYFISVVARDVSASKDSVPSNVIKYTLDTTAPTATISIDDTLLAVGETAKVTLTFSEKVANFDPATDLSLSDATAGTLSKMTSADGGKTWIGTFTPAVGLANGSTTITLADKSYSDNAGNLGAAKTSAAITIDTKAPDAPTVSEFNSGKLVNKVQFEHADGLTLSGTGEAGATVTVSGLLTGAKTATVAGDGSWSMVLNQGTKVDLLADGSTILTVTQADAVGNKSAAAPSFKITTDVTVAAPTVDAVLGDDAVNSADATAGFNITGTGEVGATVTLTFASGASLAGGNTAVVGADGKWSVAVTAADVAAMGEGSEKFTAAQVDVALNPSASSSARDLSIDTTAPATPTVALGAGVSNGATDAEATASEGVITVSGESGATIVATLTGQSGTLTKTVTGTGAAQPITLTSAEVATLGEGSVAVSVAQTDAAGNPQTVAATTTSFTIDTVIAAPTIDAVAADDIANKAETAAGFDINR